MRRRRTGQNREPTIALINIVFLMLIFFLVAGALAAPVDRGVTLVRTSGMERTAPAEALVIHADGRLTRRGMPVPSAEAFLNDLPQDARAVVRLLPDRDLPASVLVTLGRDLRQAGAERVLILTERSLR